MIFFLLTGVWRSKECYGELEYQKTKKGIQVLLMREIVKLKELKNERKWEKDEG